MFYHELEHRNLLTRLEMEIIVDGEQHHEVQEERGGGEKVPDVVVVVEVEQLALCVQPPRLCWRQEPACRLVDEEPDSAGPADPGQEEVGRGLLANSLPVPQLHEDVEGGVEEEVADEDVEQVAGKVATILGQLCDSISSHPPVGQVEDSQEEHPIRVHRLHSMKGTGTTRSYIMSDHLPDSLGEPHVHLPAAHVVDLDGEQETGNNVESGERRPEWNVAAALHHPEHPDEDHKGEHPTGSVGVGIDVRVSELVDLQHTEDGDCVHEGGVELKV